jgi:hypothetical protein
MGDGHRADGSKAVYPGTAGMSPFAGGRRRGVFVSMRQSRNSGHPCTTCAAFMREAGAILPNAAE